MLLLIDNAAKYDPPKALATLASTRSSDELCFEVADQGSGIPEAELPGIFDRFYAWTRRGTEPGRSLGPAYRQDHRGGP